MPTRGWHRPSPGEDQSAEQAHDRTTVISAIAARAAEPAAGSAHSIGVRTEAAERGFAVEQAGRTRGRFDPRFPALRARRRFTLTPLQNNPLKTVMTAWACIVDRWHSTAITNRRLSVNSSMATHGSLSANDWAHGSLII